MWIEGVSVRIDTIYVIKANDKEEKYERCIVVIPYEYFSDEDILKDINMFIKLATIQKSKIFVNYPH